MRLPVEYIDGTYPPRFKWVAPAVLPHGTRNCECEGGLPPSVDCAVRDVILLAREQATTIERLEQELAELRAETKRA